MDVLLYLLLAMTVFCGAVVFSFLTVGFCHFWFGLVDSFADFWMWVGKKIWRNV